MYTNSGLAVVLFFNFARRVGKTRLCQKFALNAVQAGKRTLVIDADPQADLTVQLGFRPSDFTDDQTIATLVQTPVSKMAKPIPVAGFEFVPANFGVRQVVTSTFIEPLEWFRFRENLEEVGDRYDVIFIDTQGHSSSLSSFLILASTHVYIPVLFDDVSADGALLTLKYMRQHQRSNPALTIAGLIGFYSEDSVLPQPGGAAESRLKDIAQKENIPLLMGQDYPFGILN
jgi:chromosome partitioning protein